MNLLKILLFISIFAITFLSIVIAINRNQVYPSLFEQKLLDDFFSKRQIKSELDIISIQNIAISKIAHVNTGIGQLNSVRTLKLNKGLCYDRSLLLQKYFIMKGFKVRPVYLFWGENTTTLLDIFKVSIQSHSVFEIYFNGDWYVIRTNSKMIDLENLSQYINKSNIFPSHTRYIKYLNNRNGEFIYPKYLPDIYFF